MKIRKTSHARLCSRNLTKSRGGAIEPKAQELIPSMFLSPLMTSSHCCSFFFHACKLYAIILSTCNHVAPGRAPVLRQIRKLRRIRSEIVRIPFCIFINCFDSQVSCPRLYLSLKENIFGLRRSFNSGDPSGKGHATCSSGRHTTGSRAAFRTSTCSVLTGFIDSFPLKNFAPGQADDSPG